MLRALFQWLDTHPQICWWVAAVPSIGLFTVVARSLWQQKTKGGAVEDRTFCGVLIALLFAWRWPLFLAARDFNQDESQLIAGARTLLADPVFWRSVDGTTSG